MAKKKDVNIDELDDESGEEWKAGKHTGCNAYYCNMACYICTSY